MFALIGAICLFSKLDCTPVGLIGPPYKTMLECQAKKHKYEQAIGPIEWLDGQFQCVRDEDVI